MLYSIIPPILIILSLIGIILFLMKKAPAAARLEEQDKKDVFNRADPAGDILEESDATSMPGRVNNLKQKFSAVPQRTSGAVRAGFSKLTGAGKVFSGVGRLTKKRNDPNLDNFEKEPVDEEIWKEKFRMFEEKQEALAGNESVSPFRTEISARKNGPLRPTISSEIVVPSKKIVQGRKREAFENILIDRIAANPKDTDAYERLGEYYIEIRSLKDAKECFKQVIKIDPKNKSVKMKMRRLERMLGR
jgi:tetratricopeptide (TPR) repeat protein